MASIGIFLKGITSNLGVKGPQQNFIYDSSNQIVDFNLNSNYSPTLTVSPSVINIGMLNWQQKGYGISTVTELNKDPVLYLNSGAPNVSGPNAGITYTPILSYNENQSDEFKFYNNISVPEPTAPNHPITKNYADTTFEQTINNVTTQYVNSLNLVDKSYLTSLNLADQNYVNSQGYITASYVTSLNLVSNPYLTSLDYASKSYVNSQGYVTSSYLASLGYIDNPSLVSLNLVDTTYLTSLDYASKSYIASLNYVTNSYLTSLNLANKAYVDTKGTVTSIVAGTGLSGGTITSSGAIAIANTGVTAGNYTNLNCTINAQGQITLASNGTSGTVTSVNATSTVSGLSGGIDITGSPITSAGTINLALSYNIPRSNNQTFDFSNIFQPTITWAGGDNNIITCDYVKNPSGQRSGIRTAYFLSSPTDHGSATFALARLKDGVTNNFLYYSGVDNRVYFDTPITMNSTLAINGGLTVNNLYTLWNSPPDQIIALNFMQSPSLGITGVRMNTYVSNTNHDDIWFALESWKDGGLRGNFMFYSGIANRVDFNTAVNLNGVVNITSTAGNKTFSNYLSVSEVIAGLGNNLVVNNQGYFDNLSLQASGQIMAVAFYAYSSKNIKNILNINDEEAEAHCSDLVSKINIRGYQYKDLIKGNGTYYGVIAEELMEVLPECVSPAYDFIANILSFSNITEIEGDGINSFKYIVPLKSSISEPYTSDRLLVLTESNKFIEVNILNKRDDSLTIVSKEQLSEKIFIRGTYEECPSVTKERLAEISIGAIKHLAKRVETLESKFN